VHALEAYRKALTLSPPETTSRVSCKIG